MKVLFDTCVWSLSLRRSRKSVAMAPDEILLLKTLSEAIKDGRVAIIGPIRQELLSGIRDGAQFKKLSTALDAFPDETLTTPYYVEAARLFNLGRSHGVECGPVDMVICATAVLKKWPIVTNDAGLSRCITVLRSEGLISATAP
jgi:predicted nucleic acid-binding protein